MDKIGFRAVQAIEEMAKKNGTRASKEYRKLDVSSNVWHSWKRLDFAPSAYFLRQMALAGYDVLYILTGGCPVNDAKQENRVITNADRIRSMSDKELVDYLVYHNPFHTENNCLEWLQQPAKD